MTVEEAAAEAGVSMATVRYWAPEALEPKRRGRTLPTAGDKLTRLRPIVLEDESELTFLVVRGSRAADRADEVFDIQWRFANGHAAEAELERIRGVRIAGRTVETDPARAAAGPCRRNRSSRGLPGDPRVIPVCVFCGRPADFRHHWTGRGADGRYLDPELAAWTCHSDHELCGNDDWHTLGIYDADPAQTTFLDSLELRLARLGSGLGRVAEALPEPLAW
jgi:hypothetical protein